MVGDTQVIHTQSIGGYFIFKFSTHKQYKNNAN